MTRHLFCLLLTALAPAAALLANQIESEEPIDIALEGAELRQTLLSFAAISGAELSMAGEIQGSVTVDLEKVAWPRALDRICRDQNLACETLPGEPPVLRVRHADLEGLFPVPPGFAEPINLSLRSADLRTTLATFEAISGIPVSVAEDVEGAVSLNVKSTPWTVVLTEVCRLSGCRVVWGESSILVERLAAEEIPTATLQLRQAELTETLRNLSAVTSILGSSRLRLEVDPTVSGGVSLDLRQVTWQQALDLICEQVGCDWALKYGDPPVLEIFRQGSEEGRVRSGVKEPGAPAKILAYRLSVPGAAPDTGTVAFTWADPIHVLGGAEGYRARLTWIPFGPELSVVVPVIERCEAAQSSVSVLDPVVLPLESEVRHQAEGVMLDVYPADGRTDPRPPPKAVPACGPDGPGRIRVAVRRLVDGDSDRPRPARRQIVDRYLLVRPVETRQPVAAVIALGSDLDGRTSFALLRPDEERRDVDVETLSLAPGEHFEKIVRADGSPFELVIEYVEAPKRE